MDWYGYIEWIHAKKKLSIRIEVETDFHKLSIDTFRFSKANMMPPVEIN